MTSPHHTNSTKLHFKNTTTILYRYRADASKSTSKPQEIPNITAPVRQRESCPFHVRPTIENGLGCPIFLPDNRLRLSGLTSTRGGRDERGRPSNSLSPNFKVYKRTNLYYVTTTTPHTAQNLHSIHQTFCRPHSSPVPGQAATPSNAPLTREPRDDQDG